MNNDDRLHLGAVEHEIKRLRKCLEQRDLLIQQLRKRNNELLERNRYLEQIECQELILESKEIL